MKKAFFLTSCFVLVLALWGCDEKINEPINQKINGLNSTVGIENVGYEHNVILNYMSSDTTYSNISISESNRLLDSSTSFLININPIYDSVEISQQNTEIATLITGKNIDSVYEAEFNAVFPTIVSELSVVEVQMINFATDYLYNYDFSSMTNSQIYNHIINKADSLITVYNSIDWDTVSTSSYMKGEGIGGLLHVMKSSAEYWSTQAPGTVVEPQGLISADAGGYIVGWVKAVVFEIWENGELRIENQYTRIGKGVAGAAGASGLAALKSFGGWLIKSIMPPA